MIAGIFHEGSGLGNQLFRYVTTRTLAEDKGYEYGMTYIDDCAGKEQGFKGKFFINQPKLVDYPERFNEWNEKKVVENGVDIRSYDPEINFVEDETLIDGEFQDERYWGHKLSEIDEWLKVEPLSYYGHPCMIGFRGGEYSVFPDLFLTQDYWNEAIELMKSSIYHVTQFEVHTDDPDTAKKFFPDFKIIHEIGTNWRSMRYAQLAIIANSSFYILPRLLRHQYNPITSMTIAPRYWARHNTKVWALPQNYYSCFKYI